MAIGDIRDEALIDNAFIVNTNTSDEFAYLVWKDSQEEVVLQVEGILAEAHHPPVIGNEMEYSGKLNDLMQSVVIVSSSQDDTFSRAIQGIEAINAFMARFNVKVNMMNNFVLGNLKAIRGQTRLLMPVGKARMSTVDISSIDYGNVLKNMMTQGSHQYTEDNVVSYLKWGPTTGGEIHILSTLQFRVGHESSSAETWAHRGSGLIIQIDKNAASSTISSMTRLLYGHRMGRHQDSKNNFKDANKRRWPSTRTSQETFAVSKGCSMKMGVVDTKMDGISNMMVHMKT
ncbi:uncharacterized protein EV420DRAFT_1487905 [Desarmillaria tabescens]|uniref:Uncharacterized protein n=1 Tax=Armillaria tabescens TaxID=1929756 RepID=A0AA39MJ31_ARMTA|nr:uncharacterized protein EV420DRAFT_1487905 [Desarmillaria tabescens]KAK0435693.1 hypothetical protein EV420DRAFT_1487905 [Desarmillaria tabescens]